MDRVRSRRVVRRRAVWVVPVLTVAAVVSGGLLLTSSASAHPTLPTRSAAQLLAAVQRSTVSGLSGTVEEYTHLGLPSLPGAGDAASLSWQSLVSGSHTARVWLAGPDKQRVALLGTLSEADVVHNGRDLWTYTSRTNQVTHTVLAAKDSGHADSGPAPDARSYAPTVLAQRILTALDPTTVVSVDPTRVVAGRAAYTLVLSPRDVRSTVRKVTIAIDSTRFVPLQVQIFGSGTAPAFSTGFTGHLSFATPNASIFDFHAPAGATMATDPLVGERGGRGGRGVHSAPRPKGSAASTTSHPRIIGTGWTAVAEFADLPAGASSGVLDQLSNPVGSTGDRILTTSLVNVLVLEDGRVFAGAVDARTLEQTAAAAPR